MKQTLFLMLFLSLSVFSFSQDLVLTAVFDGPLTGGQPKGVELYALEDIADLSLYGLDNINNGGASDGAPGFTFSEVSVTAGTFIYVAHEAEGFTSFFGFDADYISSVCNINGDDCIELYYNGSVVDVFGEVGVDGTDQDWEYTDGWAYRISNSAQDGNVFDIDHWIFSGTGNLAGGSTNEECDESLPIATYTYAEVYTNYESFQVEQVLVYPNPFTDEVTIKSSCEISSVRVMNSVSQVVKQVNVNTASVIVPTIDLKSGVYLLKIIFTDGSIQVVKVIKK